MITQCCTRIVQMISCLLVVSLLSSCAPAPTVTPMPTDTPAFTPLISTAVPSAETMPIFITTDMSSDDVVAVLYLLRHPAVQILGIGSANGVAHVEPAARNLLHLLALVGREDIPVAIGSDTPLEGNHAFPSAWRSGADNLFGLSLPEAEGQLPESSTADLLAEVVNAHPGEVTVVLLGAHTDLALALRKDSTLAERIKAVHMMGGAVRVPGNIHQEHAAIANEVAEWNLWLDYRAAAEVFGSGIPLAMVPLDATNQVRVDRAYYERFAAEATAPAAKTVAQLWKGQFRWSASGFYIWDAVAAVALTKPQVAQWESLPLAVVTDKPDHLGQVVVAENQPANTQVCFAVDVSPLQEELSRVLNR